MINIHLFLTPCQYQAIGQVEAKVVLSGGESFVLHLA
jgi:hypothetical protein